MRPAKPCIWFKDFFPEDNKTNQLFAKLQAVSLIYLSGHNNYHLIKRRSIFTNVPYKTYSKIVILEIAFELGKK